MSSQESYSIHCVSEDWRRVLAKLHEASNLSLENISDQQIIITSHSGTLKVSRLFPETGGKFGAIYVGLINKVKRIDSSAIFKRQEVIDNLKNTKMILGCVASPQFKDSDERFELIFSLAQILDGTVFDGFTLLSPNGEVIISLDGST